MFEKITEAEINQRSMANVSTTPNRPTAFGESNMDAQALKLRFDRLSRYLAGRINEIFAGMSDGNLAKNVKIVEEKGEETIEYSLAEFILKMIEGDLTQINVKVPEGTQRLDVICNQVLRWQNEIKTGDFADETVVVTGVTIRQFYEEFKKLEETGQGKPGEPGKSAYDYAVEGGYQGTEEEFAKKLATEYPSKVSQLENDEKYITASGAPVQTVNGKAGNISLSAADVGARPNTWTPTAYEVGAEPVNTVSTHNASDQAHNDIRIELRNLANRINDLLDSDDENLNELHEIVEYIKNNHTLISNITTSKVSVADIVNNLVTALPDKPLSAAQGVALKALIDAITVPTKLSQLENDKGYITGYTESDPTVPEWAKAAKKPGYTKEEIGLSNVDNVKQYSASNPPPYPVKSVNNKTENVKLTAADVEARPSTWTPTAAEVGAEKTGNVAAHNTNTAAHNDIRLLIEGLSNRINAIFDSEDTDLDELSEIVAYIKSNKDLIDAITTSKVSVSDIIDNLETSDPKKPLSAKQGVVLKALIDAITIPTKLSQLENDKKFITKSEAPVQTVNNKTGNVELSAEDVGARPDTWTPTASEVGARPDDWMPTAADVGARPSTWTPTASEVGARPATWMPSYSDVGAEKAGNVNLHNTNSAAHNDIRLLIAGLSERVNAVLDSDDTTLDELSEIVAYIKANKTLIESVTTNKVNVSDIIDDLETAAADKPLSAKQGAALKALIDAISIPTKVSQLENDKGYLTGFSESDPSVPDWAKAQSKPSYTKSEVGLGNVDNVKQYSASNPPPYPVKSVNGKTGNVELDAEDVGARPDTWTPSASEVGARPDDWMPTAADVGARPNSWTPTASDVGARPATWMPSYSDVGAEKAGNVAAHNTSTTAHNDLRILIQGLSDRINAVLDSDDTTLDELSEIVAYIKANKTLIESVTTSKVNVSDIIDNLETPDPKKPLSAAQGVYIMGILQQLVTEFGEALEGKANSDQGVFFIKGGGTTDTTNKVATWTGSHEGITEYYDGLMIAYKIGTAGSTTTTLNINGLGAVPVVKNATTAISTSFAVNSVIFLVYTVDGSTAYWKAHDYDANTRNSVGDYQKNNTKLYFVGTTTTDSATSSSYATSYTNSKCYVGADNRLYSNDEVVPNTAEIEALIETKLAEIPSASGVSF